MKIYNEICKKLIDNENFKFSRWGDGEWGCMMGWAGENRDGNHYSQDLRDALINVLDSEPDYIMGLQYGVIYNDQLREYVFNKLFRLNINWVYGDILHVASEFGMLKQFMDSLKNRNVVIIGAEYYNQLADKIGHHIIIPSSNSFEFNDSIINSASVFKQDTVFLVAAAMDSNVIIDRLPDNITAIDIGSVLDPYLNHPRARYQYKMDVSLKDLI